MTTASDENRLAIWVQYGVDNFVSFTIFGDATISEMKAWDSGVLWDFWAWADEGVDE